MNRISTRAYWLISLVLSLLAVIAIGSQWARAERQYGNGVHRVANPVELERVLAQTSTVEFRGGQQPLLIPTGLFIQSVAFVSASDVNVTGYIWQKYPQDFPAGLERGFLFPEEVASNDTTVQERYRTEVISHGKPLQLIGWYFDVTVRQSFDYSTYPLDYLTIRLRLWPKDFNNTENVFFVPDFDAYSDGGARRFGLDRQIVQGEWDIDETFFSFNDIPYDADFGYSGSAKRATYREFFFNIGAKRKFINAFVVHLVPLLLVALLLFGALMTLSNDEEQASRFGFNTSGILGTCSALFFVVLLAHVQVRSQFADSGMVYIEYFYLVMYGFLLFVALDAYLFSLRALDGRWWLNFRDNLLAKVLFWPVLLWAMVLIGWWRL